MEEGNLKKKRCIITIINSISETSMPFNEFIVNRSKTFSEDKQVVIVCSDSIPQNISLPKNIEVYCLGFNIKRIRDIVKEVKTYCEKNNIKLIIHLHQPKSAVIFYLSTLFLQLKKNTLFTVHNMFDAYDFKYKVLSMLCTLKAGQVICVSKSSYNRYPRIIKKIKKDKMNSIQNGVDLKRIDNVIEQDFVIKDKNQRELIYVARMIPVKNQKFLIELLSKVDNCKLVLIGVEDEVGMIRKLVKKKNLESRVEFTGLIPRNDVFNRLQKADIYVSPSLVEGLPISVLEAMYIGLPVILSDIKPHLEIGIHSESVVTLPLERGEWICKINRYLREDKEELIKIGSNCKKCAEANFSLKRMLVEYNKAYDKL